MGKEIVYEDSLTGFFSMLALLSDSYQGPGSDGPFSILPRGRRGQVELFGAEELMSVPENPEAVRRLLASLARTGGLSAEELSRAYLSGSPIELQALAYCRKALNGPQAALHDETDPDIRAVRAASRAVLRELHRFIGILRFRQREDGIYQAEFEPDADILELLMPHFQARFGETPFVIIDMRRGKAAGTAEPHLTEAFRPLEGKEPYVGEEECLALWKIFYHATDNPARRNPALRRHFIPFRYWKHVSELEHEEIT